MALRFHLAMETRELGVYASTVDQNVERDRELEAARPLACSGCQLQVLIEGFPADPQLTRKSRLFLSRRHAGAQLRRFLRREGLLAALIDAPLFRLGDSLRLTLANQGPLEFGEGAHDGEHEIRHGRIIPCENHALFHEFNLDAALGQVLNDSPEIIQIAGEAVHGMDHHSIAFAREGEQGFKLGPLGVLPRGRIREGPIQLDALELANRVLFGRADPNIADPLTLHRALL